MKSTEYSASILSNPSLALPRDEVCRWSFLRDEVVEKLNIDISNVGGTRKAVLRQKSVSHVFRNNSAFS